jgi:flagellin
MRINTNVSSLNTQHQLRKVEDSLAKTMERLSSGKRINGAADDAAGLAISVRMEAASRGKDVAYRNTLDGISALQTGESALGTATNVLQRMRELAVQGANGTNSDSELASLDTEYQELLTELGNMSTSTKFNGVELLGATAYSVTLQVGHSTGDTRSVGFTTDLGSLGVSGTTLDSTTANGLLDTIDTDLDAIATDRATVGAYENRLSFVQDDLDTSKTNVEAAKSRIVDADVATEVSKLSRDQIINKSAVNMLAQANQVAQGMLQLLQG